MYEIIELYEKKNKKIICIDIDNTICKTFLNKYENSKPYKKKYNLLMIYIIEDIL